MTRYFIITFIVLLMASTTMPSRAQEITKAEMARIRAAYSAAKERVELNSHAQEQNVPRSDMEIVSHYVIPGCGPTEEVIHYYFTLDEHYYYGKNGIHKSINGTAELDEVFAARKADDLKTAFTHLLNKDY